MTDRGVLSRMERLRQVENLLRADQPLVLREVAGALGVSLRTVTRDVQVLREQGVPVEADRGRGGGVRVGADYASGRIALTRGEAVDLLISLAAAERMQATLTDALGRSTRRKIVASFSPVDQRALARVRRRIRVGPPVSPAVLESAGRGRPAVIGTVREAFVGLRALTLRYRAESGASTTRLVEPHYLVFNPPLWYALCWDHLRDACRTLRFDRMSGAVLESRRFALRPYAEFEAAMAGNDTVEP